MSSDNNHYVPKLYLRNFSSGEAGEDIINFYHIIHKYAKRNVGLKNQCTRFKFYGETDDLEKKLAEYESSIAPFLRHCVASSSFSGTAADDQRLKSFIALQMVRTVGAAERLSEGKEQMMGHIEPYLATKDRRITPQNPRAEILLSLSAWKEITGCIDDLGTKIIINRTNIDFIASDNPVARYNQYCEKVKGIGLVGMACTGLQIMLPLSPRHLIFLYDKSVYKVVGKDSPVMLTESKRDIDALNLFQAIQSEEKLLFANWADLPHIEALVRRAERYRRQQRTRVIEIPNRQKENSSSLLHLQDVQQNVELNLSFVELKRNAKRVSIEDRINSYRESCPRGAFVNQKRREMRGAPNATLFFGDQKPPGWRRK